jgi:hypothetical protein
MWYFSSAISFHVGSQCPIAHSRPLKLHIDTHHVALVYDHLLDLKAAERNIDGHAAEVVDAEQLRGRVADLVALGKVTDQEVCRSRSLSHTQRHTQTAHSCSHDLRFERNSVDKPLVCWC